MLKILNDAQITTTITIIWILQKVNIDGKFWSLYKKAYFKFSIESIQLSRNRLLWVVQGAKPIRLWVKSKLVHLLVAFNFLNRRPFAVRKPALCWVSALSLRELIPVYSRSGTSEENKAVFVNGIRKRPKPTRSNLIDIEICEDQWAGANSANFAAFSYAFLQLPFQVFCYRIISGLCAFEFCLLSF